MLEAATGFSRNPVESIRVDVRKVAVTHTAIVPGGRGGPSPKSYSDNFSVARNGIPTR